MEDVILGSLPAWFESLWLVVEVILGALPAWF